MIVADASVVITALLDDGPSGDTARGALLTEQSAAPEIVYAEVLSACRSLERAGKVTARRAELAVQDLMAMPLAIAPHRPLLPRCWQLRHDVTPFNGMYVAFAAVLDAVLTTADARLARATGPTCTIHLVTEGH